MSRVFISYRRADSQAYAQALNADVSAHFGPGSVFMDMHSIPPGYDFAHYIQEAAAASDALIAVIGPAWISVTDPFGRRRLDDPADFVRLEVSAGIQMNIPLIPILVGGARMPGALDLPDVLRPLSTRNALMLRDSEWQRDVSHLVETLKNYFRMLPPGARTPLDLLTLAQEKLDRKYPLNHVARLPPVLEAGERVHNLAKATWCFDGYMNTSPADMVEGLLAVTDRRLVLLPHSPSKPPIAWPYSGILRVKRRRGPLGGAVSFRFMGRHRESELAGVEPGKRIGEIVDAISQRIGQR